MDELAKAMKVIRLRDEEFGQYLTAGEDQVSVTLTKPNTEGYNPKNTAWRLQWLKSPKGLVGQVRLWSIYNKALTFTEDPADYIYNSWSDALTQQPCPPSHGGEAASEWQLELLKRKNNNVALAGFLLKWSKKSNEYFNLTARYPSNENKSRFLFRHVFRNTMEKWANWKMYIEVVVENDNDNDNITTSSVDQKISTSPDEQPLMQRQDSANKMATSFKTGTPVKNNQESHHQPHDKSLMDTNTKLNTSVKQKTTSTPPEQPLIHNNYGGNSYDCGYLPDQFMNTFSRWQVGQVYFHMSPNATGGNTGRGFKYDHQYANSGGNVNGSGVQENGDVSLYSEINRSRDNNANFVNYKYE